MNNLSFDLMEEDGNKHYNIIKYFKNKDNNKSYIVFKTDDNDELYASSYNIINNEIVLSDLDENEWTYVESVMRDENE